MILLDPDLDPDPRPAIRTGPPSLALPKPDRARRLPSVRTLNAYLREAQNAVRLKGIVSVLLTTDAAIKKLNRNFRGKNKATDVLSFPASGVSRGEVAGDLAISVDTARKQSGEQGHSLSVEIRVLILHGLLHLAGYDHETDNGEMARCERTLRARLALPLGLIERSIKGAGRKVGPTAGGLIERTTNGAGKVAPVSRPAVARVSSPAPSNPARRRRV
jgi:probable rRNA maturation factor